MKARLILTFAPERVEKAITYPLIRDFNLWVNILRAAVKLGQEGSLLLEVEGDEHTLARAREYLSSEGVAVATLGGRVRIDEDKCLYCGACTGVCLTGALEMDEQQALVFQEADCVACATCVTACPLQAIEVCF